jgi:hypothetical protein
VQQSTSNTPNCYAHAVGYRHGAKDPGDFSCRKYANNTDTELKRAAEADGLEFAGRDKVPAVRPGYYAVACWSTKADRTNYHWARQEGQGRWSPKAGDGTVSYSDASGAELHSQAKPPHDADMRFGVHLNSRLGGYALQAQISGYSLNYNHFVGYFYCPGEGLRQQDPSCRIL